MSKGTSALAPKLRKPVICCVFERRSCIHNNDKDDDVTKAPKRLNHFPSVSLGFRVSHAASIEWTTGRTGLLDGESFQIVFLGLKRKRRMTTHHSVWSDSWTDRWWPLSSRRSFEGEFLVTFQCLAPQLPPASQSENKNRVRHVTTSCFFKIFFAKDLLSSNFLIHVWIICLHCHTCASVVADCVSSSVNSGGTKLKRRGGSGCRVLQNIKWKQSWHGKNLQILLGGQQTFLEIKNL